MGGIPSVAKAVTNSSLITVNSVDYIFSIQYSINGGRDGGDVVFLYFDPVTKELVRTTAVSLTDYFIHPASSDWRQTYIYKIAVDGANVFIPLGIRDNSVPVNNQIVVLALTIDTDFTVIPNPGWVAGYVSLATTGNLKPSYPEIAVFNDGVNSHLRIGTNTLSSLGGPLEAVANTEMWKISITDGSAYMGISGRAHYYLAAHLAPPPSYLSVLQSPVYTVEGGVEYFYCRKLNISEFSGEGVCSFDLAKYRLTAALAPVEDASWGGGSGSVFYGAVAENPNVMSILFGAMPACGYHNFVVKDGYVYAVSNSLSSRALLTLQKIDTTDGTLYDSLYLNDYTTVPAMGLDIALELSGLLSVLEVDNKLILPFSTYDSDEYVRLHLWTVDPVLFASRYVSDGIVGEVRFKSTTTTTAWAISNCVNTINDNVFGLLVITDYELPGEDPYTLDSQAVIASFYTESLDEPVYTFTPTTTSTIYKTLDRGEEIFIDSVGKSHEFKSDKFEYVDISTTLPTDAFTPTGTKVAIPYPPTKRPLINTEGVVEVIDSTSGRALTYRDRIWDVDTVDGLLRFKGSIFSNIYATWMYAGCNKYLTNAPRMLFSRLSNKENDTDDKTLDVSTLFSGTGLGGLIDITHLNKYYVLSVEDDPLDSTQLIATLWMNDSFAGTYHIAYCKITKPTAGVKSFLPTPASAVLSADIGITYEPNDSKILTVGGTPYVYTVAGDKVITWDMSAGAPVVTTLSVDFGKSYIKQTTLYTDGSSAYMTVGDSTALGALVASYNLSADLIAWQTLVPIVNSNPTVIACYGNKVYALVNRTETLSSSVYDSLTLYVFDYLTGEQLARKEISREFVADPDRTGTKNNYSDITVTVREIFIRYSGKLSDYTGIPTDTDFSILTRMFDTNSYELLDTYISDIGTTTVDKYSLYLESKDSLLVYSMDYVVSYLPIIDPDSGFYTINLNLNYEGVVPIYGYVPVTHDTIYIESQTGARYQKIDSVFRKVSEDISVSSSTVTTWANDTCPIIYGLPNGATQGACSTAIGHCTTSCADSVAVGRYVSALGVCGVAIGECASLNNCQSVAIGYVSQGYGDGSVAIGASSCSTTSGVSIGMTALGCTAGVAIGAGASSGFNSVAIGNNAALGCLACSSYVSIGSATCPNEVSVTIGTLSSSGTGSVSVGYCAGSGNCYGVAVGYNSQSTCTGSTAVGYNTTSCCGSTVLGQAACGVGGCAIAIGTVAKSICASSIAIGTCSAACAADSITIGTCSCNISTGGIAIGCCSTTGASSACPRIAIGPQAVATGDCSIAFGYSTQAYSIRAVAIGADSISYNLASITLGENNHSCSTYSIAIGSGNRIGLSGHGDIGIGTNVTTSGGSATAVGNSAYSCACGGIAIGCIARVEAGSAHGISIGTGSCSCYANSIAIGCGARASCGCTTAVGGASLACTEFASAFGYCSLARGQCSVAIGGGATTACSISSIVIGQCSTIDSTWAIAIGYNSHTSGVCGGVAIGYAACVSCASIAIGSNTSSSDFGVSVGNGSSGGCCSVAIGNYAATPGVGSIAIGSNATATCNFSVILGYAAKACTDHSAIAIGLCSCVCTGSGISIGITSVSQCGGVAIGTCANALNTHSVAIGRDSTARRLREHWVAGNLFSSTPGTINTGRGQVSYYKQYTGTYTNSPLYIDNAGGTQEFVLSTSRNAETYATIGAMTFRVMVTGKDYTSGLSVGFIFNGAIDYTISAATLLGVVDETKWGGDADLDVEVMGDAGAPKLHINVSDASITGRTMEWSATIIYDEQYSYISLP